MALILLLESFAFFRHRHGPLDLFFSLGLAPVWLLIAAVGWWRKWHRPDFEPDYAKEQHFDLTEEGIFRVTEGTAKVRVPWTKIGRYVETDEFFLLSSPWPWGIDKPAKPSILAKQDKPTLYILPKRAFGSADAERFRGLLQRKLSVWAKNPGLKAETILTARGRNAT